MVESTPWGGGGGGGGGSVGRILSFMRVELDKLKNIILPTVVFARKAGR